MGSIDEYVKTEAIQVIDENKKFNELLPAYVSATAKSAGTERYHIVSVFGSQSTGKSTLLNHLFNTKFDVMDEVNRQQTTKGIWMARSPGIRSVNSVNSEGVDGDSGDGNGDSGNGAAGEIVGDSGNGEAGRNGIGNTSAGGVGVGANVLVMDVEGTDGRERGEDQDFERKAALFALSTSEILIVNIWEHQVGLYQGANMGLLKTVFEVNLSLFGRTKLEQNDHKVLLLFVIRDHIGVTPQESLLATITQDLHRVWDTLNKPEETAHLTFGDFFDVAFHAVGHKLLQAEKFDADVRRLGLRFVDPSAPDYLFHPQYAHDIPLDAWAMYAESCWDQIDSNKDLDLPTQQILVAKFKCDEIAAACLQEVEPKMRHLREDAVARTAAEKEVQIDYEETGRLLTDVRNEVLEDFTSQAGKYNRSVFEEKRAALAGKLHLQIEAVVAVYAEHLIGSTGKTLAASLAKKSSRRGSFSETAAELSSRALAQFLATMAILSVNGDVNIQNYVDSVRDRLAAVVARQQTTELNNVVLRHVRKLTSGLDAVIAAEVAKPTDETWDRILAKFSDLNQSLAASYSEDFGLGTSKRLNSFTREAITFQSWQLLDKLLRKHINKDSLLSVLKDRFDDRFRYDENGVPKLYQNTRELDISFGAAREFALAALPILSYARTSSGEPLKPAVDVRSRRLQKKFSSVKGEKGTEETDRTGNSVNSDISDISEEESDEDSETADFAQIVSKSDVTTALNKFKKEADARFVESKRAMLQHVTQIPWWIYVVILVLGWNEFMAVLRNPFFFTLLILLAAGVYALHTLNMLGPAIAVGRRLADESVSMAKEKLREVLLDDPNEEGRRLAKVAGKESPDEL